MDLTQQSCQDYPKGSVPLSSTDAQALLAQCNHWEINSDNNEIMREYRFKNYYETIAFVNALAWICHTEDHHPDLKVSYNRCTVVFNTHTVGGLSKNDFICAAKANALIRSDQ